MPHPRPALFLIVPCTGPLVAPTRHAWAVHQGWGAQARHARQAVLDTAYAAHPDRFVRRRPTPPTLPEVVWINPPTRPAPLANSTHLEVPTKTALP